MLAMHAGHISCFLVTSFSLFPVAGFPFLSIRPTDRAIPAKTCDTRPPTGRPAGAVWHRVAFHQHAYYAGAEAYRHSLVRACVSTQRGVTWRLPSSKSSDIIRHAHDQ